MTYDNMDTRQVETGSARKYRGLVQLLACMPREEGLAALWKGERCGTRLVVVADNFNVIKSYTHHNIT